MKIIHIFPNSLFINPFMEMMLEDRNEHIFFVTDIAAKTKIQEKYYEKYQIKHFSTFVLKDAKRLRDALKESCDLVIIHSLYLNYLLLSLLYHKKILQKSILVLWGGSDSKPFRVSKENRKYALQAMVYEFLRKNIYRSVPYIGTIIEEDYENIKKIYHTKAKDIMLKYPIPTSAENLKPKKQHGTIHIQVGHSGSIDNQTIEALKILEKFKEEDIKIYTPLSYGNEEYSKKVQEVGKKCFKDKYVPLLTLMSGDEYSKHLSNMDVLVMNTEVQQGLGNIYAYFYMKKKVYLNSKGALKTYFEREKIHFSLIDDISNQSFKEFCKMKKEFGEENYEKTKIIYDWNSLRKMWNKMFQKALKEKKNK